jgi:hypothetical protein
MKAHDRKFKFQPRWKEELVVVGNGGSFVLELPMGILTAYLPTEEVWQESAPIWARALWPDLRAELEDWCKKNDAGFEIDRTATVFPEG